MSDKDKINNIIIPLGDMERSEFIDEIAEKVVSKIESNNMIKRARPHEVDAVLRDILEEDDIIEYGEKGVPVEGIVQEGIKRGFEKEDLERALEWIMQVGTFFDVDEGKWKFAYWRDSE